MFKRLICGVPAVVAATDSHRSLKLRRSGKVHVLLVAGGLALLTSALLPLMSGGSEKSVALPAVNCTPQSRAVHESDSDDFAPINDLDAVELLPDNFIALSDDDATLTELDHSGAWNRVLLCGTRCVAPSRAW